MVMPSSFACCFCRFQINQYSHMASNSQREAPAGRLFVYKLFILISTVQHSDEFRFYGSRKLGEKPSADMLYLSTHAIPCSNCDLSNNNDMKKSALRALNLIWKSNIISCFEERDTRVILVVVGSLSCCYEKRDRKRKDEQSTHISWKRLYSDSTAPSNGRFSDMI